MRNSSRAAYYAHRSVFLDASTQSISARPSSIVTTAASLHNRSFFFFNDTATTEIYTLSLHDALPISPARRPSPSRPSRRAGRGRRGARTQHGHPLPVHDGFGPTIGKWLSRRESTFHLMRLALAFMRFGEHTSGLHSPC